MEFLGISCYITNGLLHIAIAHLCNHIMHTFTLFKEALHLPGLNYSNDAAY